jgi:hypothetical protein
VEVVGGFTVCVGVDVVELVFFFVLEALWAALAIVGTAAAKPLKKFTIIPFPPLY